MMENNNDLLIEDNNNDILKEAGKVFDCNRFDIRMIKENQEIVNRENFNSNDRSRYVKDIMKFLKLYPDEYLKIDNLLKKYFSNILIDKIYEIPKIISKELLSDILKLDIDYKYYSFYYVFILFYEMNIDNKYEIAEDLINKYPKRGIILIGIIKLIDKNNDYKMLDIVLPIFFKYSYNYYYFKNGETLLHLLIKHIPVNIKLDIYQKNIDNIADINRKDIKGFTILDYAKKYRNTSETNKELYKYLKSISGIISSNQNNKNELENNNKEILKKQFNYWNFIKISAPVMIFSTVLYWIFK